MIATPAFASAEPREAAGQRGKRRNRRGQSPPPRFRGERAAVSKIRFRKRSDQYLILDLGWYQGAARAS
jgi:hypothetical protein